MVDPGTAQFVQMHTQLQIPGFYFLEHGLVVKELGLAAIVGETRYHLLQAAMAHPAALNGANYRPHRREPRLYVALPRKTL
jgi:hypothetical protein